MGFRESGDQSRLDGYPMGPVQQSMHPSPLSALARPCVDIRFLFRLRCIDCRTTASTAPLAGKSAYVCTTLACTATLATLLHSTFTTAQSARNSLPPVILAGSGAFGYRTNVPRTAHRRLPPLRGTRPTATHRCITTHSMAVRAARTRSARLGAAARFYQEPACLGPRH